MSHVFTITISALGCLLVGGCYLETGIAAVDHVEREIKSACPGHRTGFETHPWGRYFSIATWPIGMSFQTAMRAFTVSRACNRFDAL